MLLRSFESFEKTENGYLIHGDAKDHELTVSFEQFDLIGM